jgi:ABC-type Fe3+-hydroxamate transport system substrate-binding protein
MAGGENLFGATGRPSPRLDWDQLVMSDPDLILVHPCGTMRGPLEIVKDINASLLWTLLTHPLHLNLAVEEGRSRYLHLETVSR